MMDYFRMAAAVSEAEEKKKQKSPRKFRLPEADSTPKKEEPEKEEPEKEEPAEPEKEEPAE